MTGESGAYEATDCTPVPLEECLSAILGGVVRRGFDGPDGVSKDEALDYAATLARRVKAVLTYIEDTGCTCPGEFQYASLTDHEHGCVAQIEHLLTTNQSEPAEASS